MAEDHGWGGASRAGSNPRAGFRQRCPSLSKEGQLFLVLMSPWIAGKSKSGKSTL